MVKGDIMTFGKCPRLILFLLVLGVLAGCSVISNYGKLTPVYKTADGMTVAELEEFWEDYHVTYTGCCGGATAAKDHPSAVIFDPIGDEKTLKGDRWLKVESAYRLNKLITQIQGSERFETYYPELYRIMGSDGEFYGYMFTSWRHVPMKQLDENTMYVFDLEHPPYLHPVGGLAGPTL
jgi:hypothetical protein